MAQWQIVDKTFLITGGASGLGALYAETILKEGAKKVLILDINESQGPTTAERLNKQYGNRVVFVKCDMSKEEAIGKAFDKALEEVRGSQIDVIINNAGIMNDSPEVWRTMCEVNYLGLVSLTLKGVKYMSLDSSGNGGTIINVSSVLGLQKMRQLPIYCGTKMGVLHFTQSLSMPPGHNGVRIMTICLGATDTPLLHDLGSKSFEPQTSNELEEVGNQTRNLFQRPECAAAGVVKMLKEGADGSVWLCQSNEPGKDITDTIKSAYDLFDTILSTRDGGAIY